LCDTCARTRDHHKPTNTQHHTHLAVRHEVHEMRHERVALLERVRLLQVRWRHRFPDQIDRLLCACVMPQTRTRARTCVAARLNASLLAAARCGVMLAMMCTSTRADT
jgi:hypothetical protein